MYTHTNPKNRKTKTKNKEEIKVDSGVLWEDQLLSLRGAAQAGPQSVEAF